mmetsp:Transcript_17215/g.26977  ORF Transcript_17215/g.26977 Transcript_17215/m.26977 type:complete len:589 (+) Transcript_17215:58-1824(+)
MTDEDVPPNDDEYYCTRAVTGADNDAYQAIYICDTCQLLPPQRSNDDGKNTTAMNMVVESPQPLPSCICQSCAEVCHAGHDVYFVGMGLCTCDCPNLVIAEENQEEHHCCGCVLEHNSIEEAKKLGFDSTNTTEELKQLNSPLPLKVLSNSMLLPGAASMISENGDSAMSEDGGDDIITNKFCIECDRSMKGYSFGVYTLPALTKNVTMCQSLIRQAELLVGESKETFWMPALDEMDCSEQQQQPQKKDWCDLEILAREIYQHHVKSYCLDDGERAAAPSGGAEWWVQYKESGSEKAPVDLHYDKDEIIAEKFGLGSFPTLSTVTYLTGRDDAGDDSNGNENTTDNEPTVIFSHIYDDDEDKPIEMMLLSHAVRGKHIVFDGRLLHGAPSNAAWNPHAKRASSPSSLRVTFLVNVWLTGKPAGVDILPNAIRAKVIAANDGVDKVHGMMLPDFRERHVSRLTVPKSSDEKIILPFVSAGATWIDESAEQDGNNETAESDEEAQDDDNEDGEEEEEEEELVLCLPQFSTPEYINERPDTALFTFEGGAARLIRGDVQEDDEAELENEEDCRWRLLIASRKEEADNGDKD